MYEGRDGWIALERPFWEELLGELDLKEANKKELAGVFRREKAEEWEKRAAERDLPIVTLSDTSREDFTEEEE